MFGFVRSFVRWGKKPLYCITYTHIAGFFCVFVFAIVFSTTWIVTDKPEFCELCHPDFIPIWEKSTHKTLECAQCHVAPGVKGAFAAKIEGLQNVYVYFTKGNILPKHTDPLNISTDNCLSCHQGILRFNEMGFEDLPPNSLKADGLTMDHRIHVEKHNMDCVWCHRGTVHRDPLIIGKYDYNMPTHDDCAVCHNGKPLAKYSNITLSKREDELQCTMCHATYENAAAGIKYDEATQTSAPTDTSLPE